MKKAYLKQLDEVKFPEQRKKLPHSSRGRPLKLGEYDDIVKEYVHHLRLADGIINRSIVIAAARGILSHLAPARLKEHGGDIEIERSWAQSFLGRLGYVRRKISLLKPIHANWLMDVIFKLKMQEGLIKTGFDKAGITSFEHVLKPKYLPANMYYRME